jgi:hypothetical protein
MNWARKIEAQFGVICGTDAHQEWLLPWWWERYSACNNFPVTFVDYGMTQSARQWCEKKGELIALDIDMGFVKTREEIDPELVPIWDAWVDWNSRKAWYKKPFALLHSRYGRGVWLDLDCEVLGSIEPLFSLCDSESQIALARHRNDHLPRFHPDIYYNGGVIVFEHGAEIIERWARDAVERNQYFPGDDFLLTALVRECQLKIIELPDIYHWNIINGINPNAVIVHWMCNKKNYIKAYGGMKPLLENFYRCITNGEGPL